MDGAVIGGDPAVDIHEYTGATVGPDHLPHMPALRHGRGRVHLLTIEQPTEGDSLKTGKALDRMNGGGTNAIRVQIVAAF